ncbi:MAG: hypothetical protein ACFFCD_17110, partial [Promethearchaeota archaeon]
MSESNPLLGKIVRKAAQFIPRLCMGSCGINKKIHSFAERTIPEKDGFDLNTSAIVVPDLFM